MYILVFCVRGVWGFKLVFVLRSVDISRGERLQKRDERQAIKLLISTARHGQQSIEPVKYGGETQR